MNGITAFREAFVSAGPQDEGAFGDFDARRMRYSIFWAFYENTAYRDIHRWAKLYRAEYGLYRYIRNIYNPAYRLGEFWKAHLWGGALDPQAGDGLAMPSALPILTGNEALRGALSQVWRWSNWQVNKDLVGLYGAVMGDAALRIVDDTGREKVYLKLVHPGTIKDLTLDGFGNVKGYVLEEQRPDPQKRKRTVTYQEAATREGQDVRFRTYLDDKLYAWDGISADWSVPYGFVPLVFIQHNNVGLDWGWSELHPVRSKFHEVDDLASKLSDQIRKMVDAPWLFAGVPKPEKRTGPAETGPEDLPVIYGPPAANAIPLVAPLDIGATSAYIQSILQEIERDYPELNTDLRGSQANEREVSGRALRINRQPAETKVLQRRANYDDALVRAQQMAVAIGGFRGYAGCQGFGLDSYASGALDHSIGGRDVFAKDPADDLELEKLFWEVADASRRSGLPLAVYLRRQGWSEVEIGELTSSPEYRARLANLKAAMTLDEADNG